MFHGRSSCCCPRGVIFIDAKPTLVFCNSVPEIVTDASAELRHNVAISDSIKHAHVFADAIPNSNADEDPNTHSNSNKIDHEVHDQICIAYGITITHSVSNKVALADSNRDSFNYIHAELFSYADIITGGTGYVRAKGSSVTVPAPLSADGNDRHYADWHAHTESNAICDVVAVAVTLAYAEPVCNRHAQLKLKRLCDGNSVVVTIFIAVKLS